MKYAIWGAGTECMKYSWEFLSKIDFIIDNDINKQGTKFMGGINIVAPQRVDYNDLMVVVSSIYYYEEIRRELESYGLVETKDFVWGPRWNGDKCIPAAYSQNTWESMDKSGIYDMNKGEWDDRIKSMSALMDYKVSSVMDLGAGAMSLKKFINPSILYYPIDYYKRFDETIVCDLNRDGFSDIRVDCCICSGVLEYIDDLERFIMEVAGHCKTAIISYAPIETFDDFQQRHKSGWRNAYTIGEIVVFFSNNMFRLVKELMLQSKTIILKFEAST